jgi:hypothetical protein
MGAGWARVEGSESHEGLASATGLELTRVAARRNLRRNPPTRWAARDCTRDPFPTHPEQPTPWVHRSDEGSVSAIALRSPADHAPSRAACRQGRGRADHGGAEARLCHHTWAAASAGYQATSGIRRMGLPCRVTRWRDRISIRRWAAAGDRLEAATGYAAGAVAGSCF